MRRKPARDRRSWPPFRVAGGPKTDKMRFAKNCPDMRPAAPRRQSLLASSHSFPRRPPATRRRRYGSGEPTAPRLISSLVTRVRAMAYGDDVVSVDYLVITPPKGDGPPISRLTEN